MIWRLKNHEGEKVWYSKDVIDRILQICKDTGFLTYQVREGVMARKENWLAAKIITIIENEDRNGLSAMVK